MEALEMPLAITLIVAALVIAVLPYTRTFSAHLTTLIHELGHGVVQAVFGGGIPQIRLYPDTSGETVITNTRVLALLVIPHRILSLFVGYPAPVYLGATLLIAAHFGNVSLGSWLLFPLGYIALIVTRNWFGFLIAVTYVAICLAFFFIAALNPLWLMVFLGTLLIVRGLFDVCQVGAWVFTGGNVLSDFHLAANEMLFGPKFWFIFFIINNVAFVWLALFIARMVIA